MEATLTDLLCRHELAKLAEVIDHTLTGFNPQTRALCGSDLIVVVTVKVLQPQLRCYLYRQCILEVF